MLDRVMQSKLIQIQASDAVSIFLPWLSHAERSESGGERVGDDAPPAGFSLGILVLLFQEDGMCEKPSEHTAEAVLVHTVQELRSADVAAVTWEVAMVCKGVDGRARASDVARSGWSVVASLERGGK